MTRISSYGSYLTTLQALGSGQSNIATLSEQLNSGKKATDIAYYGTQTQKLLDLRTELAQRTGYSQTIDQVMTRVKTYDTVLTRMEDMVTELSSVSRLPAGPGSPGISAITNASSGAMKVSVDTVGSRFTAEAKYTITAVPSETGPAGSFDVTVVDGLGGKSTNTINLKQVPPAVDADRFVINGGPGDGAVIKLNIEKLEGPGTSSFNVTWPDLSATKELVKGMTAELEALLNERVGDRYLFSGSRLNTMPVTDVISAKQVMRTTLVGSRGDADEVYEMVLNGERFTYTTTGTEASLDEVLTNAAGTGIVDQIRAFTPPFNVSINTHNGIVTVTGNDPAEKFTLTTAVYDNGMHDNGVLPAPAALNPGQAPYTIQVANTTDPQIDNVKLHGDEADVGDVFNMEIGARTIVQNENAPPQVIIAGPTKYSYVVSAKDVDEAALAGIGITELVTQKLVAQINADSASTVTASIDPGDTTNIVLTGKLPNTEFQTTASVNNAGNKNALITNELPPLAEMTAFSEEVEPPKLPFYDVDYRTIGSNAAAYDIANMAPDEGLRVNYGVTSNDPAIQKLVTGLRQLTAAISRPGEYSTLMKDARNTLISAGSEIRGVHARVVNASATMDNAQTRHQEALTKVKNEIAGIEGVDKDEVAVRLQAAMTTQEGAYTVAGRMQSLSLINFLT